VIFKEALGVALSEAELLAKVDERKGIDDERDIREMKMTRMLGTILTVFFFS
jgi:hypothetical protein